MPELQWVSGTPCNGKVYYQTAGEFTLNKWPAHHHPFGLFHGKKFIGQYVKSAEAKAEAQRLSEETK